MKARSNFAARIRFAKRGAMKFIGHLDIMRYFQKAIRRAGIDITYSGGYSPHQIMSFAAPLGVGVTSEGEYFDIQLNSGYDPEQMKEDLNKVMVEGIEILDFKMLKDTAKKSMSIVSEADYLISFRYGVADDLVLSDVVKKFYEQPEIRIIKKSKKSEKEVDIKPMIHEIRTEKDSVFMKLATGSVSNLKPDLVMESFYQFAGIEMPEFALLIKRLEVYFDE